MLIEMAWFMIASIPIRVVGASPSLSPSESLREERFFLVKRKLIGFLYKLELFCHFSKVTQNTHLCLPTRNAVTFFSASNISGNSWS